jgi:acyl dehydratase
MNPNNMVQCGEAGECRMSHRLFLDDLSPGQHFTSRPRQIDAAEIKEFAARYDPQPFHMDETAGKQSLFGGLAASGWHTAGVSMAMVVECLPLAGGVIGGGGELLWTKPVRPGDMLRVECEILEVTPSRSRPERGAVVVRCLTLNQRDEVVQSFTPKLVVPRRAAGADQQ